VSTTLLKGAPGLTPRHYPDHQRSGHPKGSCIGSKSLTSLPPLSVYRVNLRWPGLRFDRRLPELELWNLFIY
jgi:hypothetical protein